MFDSTGPSWRSVYWFGVAVGASLSIIVFLTYKPEPPLATREIPTKKLLKNFDFLGFAGVTIGLVLFLVGIIYEPQYGPRSVKFLVLLIVGFFTLVATGFQRESKFTRDGEMFPLTMPQRYTLRNLLYFTQRSGAASGPSHFRRSWSSLVACASTLYSHFIPCIWPHVSWGAVLQV
jgi:hypothetical protein